MPKAPQIWKDWPACQTCNGAGVEYGETCMGCGGSGRDADCCSRCKERGAGFNDDGQFLCEDCLFGSYEAEMEREYGPDLIKER